MEIEDSLDSGLEQFEYGLNVAGYIPFISTVSGALRINYGQLEMIGAVATAAILAINALFASDSSDKEWYLNKAGEVLVKYVMHGGANVIRGVFESVPFLSLVTCLPYDLLGNRFSYFPTIEHHPFMRPIR